MNIVEALKNAKCNLAWDKPWTIHEKGMDQLHNAICLLEKGWPPGRSSDMTGETVSGEQIPEQQFLSLTDALREARHQLEQPHIRSITLRKLRGEEAIIAMSSSTVFQKSDGGSGASCAPITGFDSRPRYFAKEI
ncbi:MAG: hypothetical protein OEW09_04755 [Anaerolineae bacterium]|nr:hypothetical protein [Anaerolineae bacterium]